jgi:hypothetical protein
LQKGKKKKRKVESDLENETASKDTNAMVGALKAFSADISEAIRDVNKHDEQSGEGSQSQWLEQKLHSFQETLKAELDEEREAEEKKTEKKTARERKRHGEMLKAILQKLSKGKKKKSSEEVVLRRAQLCSRLWQKRRKRKRESKNV